MIEARKDRLEFFRSNVSVPLSRLTHVSQPGALPTRALTDRRLNQVPRLHVDHGKEGAGGLGCVVGCAVR